MAIRVALRHVTTYKYDRPVDLSPHVVRLRPAPHCRTPIPSYTLRVKPEGHFLNWQQDPYSNHLARLVFPKPARALSIEVDLLADLTVINPFDFFVEPSAETYPFVYEPVIAKELIPYLETEPAGPKLRALFEEFRQDGIRTVDHLVAINARLNREVRYVIRMEPGIQTCEQTLGLASGSCRDSAWVLVQTLRNLGIAARFVSGYLVQLRADVEALDGPSGTSVDFTDLHAWAEAYIPGAGWIGLDATSGLLCGEGHIPLACAADPLSAAPVSGGFSFAPDPSRGPNDRCVPEFSFTMSVTRVHEDPRVTLPFTDHQWAEVEALGHRVDERLAAGDVRLTMGGEPTFVSIDDMEGAEWNTAAVGPVKRKLAGRLLHSLAARFAKGPLLHYGLGKWYPGEPLPRWALGCFWRRDGVPIWSNPKLIADDERDYGFGAEHAERFAHTLADRLGIPTDCLISAYEDVHYYLWVERRLPVNVNTIDNKLESPEDRQRVAQVYEQGVGKSVGFVMPIRRDDSAGGSTWRSSPWPLRRERLFLVPGDSPIGLRLPLNELPWTAEEDREPIIEEDPFADRAELPSRAELDRQRKVAVPAGSATAPAAPRTKPAIPPGKSARGIVRTALCVQPRDGRLHVFMPPVEKIEHYLELIAAVEQVAADLGTPVMIEGYTPPHDHRVNHLSVTPDPGVIEVNMHPAKSWGEMVEQTTVLYEEARLNRLGTEKFMLDGRHSGTGGGNHIVLGGPSPADSPILRRPDLLRSLVAYWHNHPSLSYLFSGLFVGPTSQAPRVDEARDDSLYEMEIAFSQIPEHGECPPWLVDRVFRNLLVDVTGNTHRAEFCIDKLYSPDTSSGRRGLVELRAFEMPPHARMSLVQQLLIRALVARFWERPYHEPLTRWGTTLHDRFVLPHFVNDDFQDVLAELQEAGLPMRPEWFATHFEFRFPKFGSVTRNGLTAELRQAIEPWHVLGEEGSAGGAVRYVDSSVERLEVKVHGATEGRHIVACNGRRVPLHPTGVRGELVAGVRFRAWQPPSCLHPTIGVHAPLLFDIIDRWAGRSIGGFSYHVAHPGGRSYDRFPVNAYEAEARRGSRFVAFGHTPGSIAVPAEEPNPEAPLTLDLRRPARCPGPAGC